MIATTRHVATSRPTRAGSAVVAVVATRAATAITGRAAAATSQSPAAPSPSSVGQQRQRRQRRRALLPLPPRAAAVGSGGADSATSPVTIKVGGMVCDGCSSRVEAALKAAPGVASASVDLEKGVATVVVVGPAGATAAALVALIEGLGFEAALQQ